MSRSPLSSQLINEFITGMDFDNVLWSPEFHKVPVSVNLEMTLADMPFRNASVGTLGQSLSIWDVSW